ncbi:hypothetical protein [Flavobacterium sp.]|uniref:hypothetical protein n=1 Tax=Flavobacterium sp. TaxID=239 RepID=UPI00286D5890|nr:hypothetical protein [Flavobacterium sp.]
MFIKKIKKNIFYLMALVMISCNAQNNKTISGECDGMYFMGDNTFVFIKGYGMELGTYRIDNDKIYFNSNKKSVRFSLYGRKNNSVKKGIRIMFDGFDIGSFIKFQTTDTTISKKFQPILDKDIGAFTFPYIHNSLVNTKTFYLTEENTDREYKFENNTDFNDFILFYRKDKETSGIEESLSGKIKILKNGKSILVSGQEIKLVPFTKSSLSEIETYKRMYLKSFPIEEYYYCNAAYNDFDEKVVDMKQYKINDEKQSEYIKIKKANNAFVNKQDDFDNDKLIYRYKKIQNTIEKIDFSKISIDKKALFDDKYEITEKIKDTVPLEPVIKSALMEVLPERKETKK